MGSAINRPNSKTNRKEKSVKFALSPLKSDIHINNKDIDEAEMITSVWSSCNILHWNLTLYFNESDYLFLWC